MKRYYFILVCLLLASCKDAKYEIRNSKFSVLRNPVTLIDEKPIQLIDIKGISFNKDEYDDIKPVPFYFSGLTPKYPMTIGYTIFRTTESFKPRHSLKHDGGMALVLVNLLIQKDSKVIEVNSKKMLDSLFMPINDSKEAISYLSVLTDSYPIYDFSFLKRRFEYTKNVIRKSYVDSLSDRYVVHLFKYAKYGCSHPYFEDTYILYKKGNYKLPRFKSEVQSEINLQ
jgi:hypothetical protein